MADLPGVPLLTKPKNVKQRFMKPKAMQDDREQVHGEFFFRGELIEFHGPCVSLEEVVLPEGVKIEPWAELPTMVWLKYRGVTIAGPCKKKVMYSFVFAHAGAKLTVSPVETLQSRRSKVYRFAGRKFTVATRQAEISLNPLKE